MVSIPNIDYQPAEKADNSKEGFSFPKPPLLNPIYSVTAEKRDGKFS